MVRNTTLFTCITADQEIIHIRVYRSPRIGCNMKKLRINMLFADFLLTTTFDGLIIFEKREVDVNLLIYIQGLNFKLNLQNHLVFNRTQ